MELTPITFIIVCPLVFLAGFVDAAAGGGGLISLPAYLLAGLPPHLASGTNKASAMCGTTAALLRYQRSGRIDWSAALPAALLALPGAYLGARLQMLAPADTMRIVMAVCIPLLAVFLLRNRELMPKRPLSLSKKTRAALCAGAGFFLGVYDGFFGPGTGTFLIIAFTFFCGMELVTASGSAKVVNLITNLASFAAFAVAGNVWFPLALPAALCAVSGGTLGAHLTVRRGTRLIKPAIWCVLALMMARILYDLFLA